MSDVNGTSGKKRETSNELGTRRTEVGESVTDVLEKQLQQHQMHRLQRESHQQQHHLPSLRIDTALARAETETETKGGSKLQKQGISSTSSVKIAKANHLPGKAPRLEDTDSLASLLSPLSIQTPSILSNVLTGAQTLDADITQTNKVPFPSGSTTTTTTTKHSGTGVSVSFQLPRGDTPAHHRHSISCVPATLRDGQHRKRLTVEDIVKAMRSKQSGSDGTEIIQQKSNQDEKTQEALDDGTEDVDVEVEEKSCSVHMPGDFVYLSRENEEAVSETSTRLSTPALEVASAPSASGSRSTSPFPLPPTSTALERARTCSAPVTCPTSTLPKDKKVVFRKHAFTSTATTATATSTEPQIPFTEYFQEEDDNKIHILLGATGSVASIKIPLIIDKLLKIYTPDRVSIQLIVTKAAETFLNNLKISSLVKIWRDEDSVSMIDGETLLFRELRLWSDIFLIAPLSANTLAKLANGICDNLLTSVFRDWTDTAVAPVLIAPAMNTFMYINPMTKKHLKILKESFAFVEVLRPVEKVLVCGDIGMGGMREWVDIVEIVRHRIKEILRNRHESASDKEDKEDANDELLLNTPPSAEEEEEEEEDNNSGSGGDDDEDEEEEDNSGKDDDDDEDDDLTSTG